MCSGVKAFAAGLCAGSSFAARGVLGSVVGAADAAAVARVRSEPWSGAAVGTGDNSIELAGPVGVCGPSRGACAAAAAFDRAVHDSVSGGARFFLRFGLARAVLRIGDTAAEKLCLPVLLPLAGFVVCPSVALTRREPAAAAASASARLLALSLLLWLLL